MGSSRQRSDDADTPYSIDDDHWDDDPGPNHGADSQTADSQQPANDSSDESAHAQAIVDTQTVTVVLEHADSRDEKYDVHVSHGDHEWCPVAFTADRSHELLESSQWDPDGRLDWADLPTPVQEQVADTIAAVDDPSDLDPGCRAVKPKPADGGQND